MRVLGLWGRKSSAVPFGAKSVHALSEVFRTHKGPTDPLLSALIVGIIAFGVVMVYSSSAVFASKQYGNGHYFLVRQAAFATTGLALMWLVSRVDYHRYRRLTYPFLVVTIVLLGVVAVGLGRRAGGAARWIPLGPINIQPAELAKMALVLWLSHSLSKKAERIKSFSVGFLPHVLVTGFVMLLCLMQPDFGSAMMLALLLFLMLFSAGAKLGYILGAIFSAAPLVYAMIASSEYRMRRIHAFLDPFRHRYDEGYQIAESLMSFGSGGLSGVGIGDSRQKLLFLPESHTDFIGAIIGEELGLIGILFVMCIYVAIVIRGVLIAFRLREDYGAYIAFGISMFVGIQAFTNLAVAMGMLPTKGLVLPFISYGGSSLLVNCGAMGILLNISRYVRPSSARANGSTGEREHVDREPSGRAVGRFGGAFSRIASETLCGHLRFSIPISWFSVRRLPLSSWRSQ